MLHIQSSLLSHLKDFRIERVKLPLGYLAVPSNCRLRSFFGLEESSLSFLVRKWSLDRAENAFVSKKYLRVQEINSQVHMMRWSVGERVSEVKSSPFLLIQYTTFILWPATSALVAWFEPARGCPVCWNRYVLDSDSDLSSLVALVGEGRFDS